MHDRPESETKVLTEKLKHILCKKYPDRKDEKFTQVRPNDVVYLFDYLIDYRVRLYGLTYYKFSGMQEGFSSGLYYAFRLRRELNSNITNEVNEIDYTLRLILDPREKDISIDVLKTKYQYPTVDLESVDAEYDSDKY